MKLRVPQNAGKFLSSCTIGGFSRRAQLHDDDDDDDDYESYRQSVGHLGRGISPAITLYVPQINYG
jgi:hypothetical protein